MVSYASHRIHARLLGWQPVHRAPLRHHGHAGVFVLQHLRALPATFLPVFLGADVNAGVKWQLPVEGPPSCWGEDCKGRALLDALPSSSFYMLPHQDAQLNQATSRPRKAGARGRIIDWMACKNDTACRVELLRDSCFQIGTDHDLICVALHFRPERREIRRVRTGKRLVTSTVPPTDKIDQTILETLARQHTAPPPGKGYKDTPETRALFRRARRTRDPEDWKLALRTRKKAQDEWRANRIRSAVAGDWEAVRALNASKGQGWETKFACNVAPEEPHQVLHQHFSTTFSCPAFSSHRSTCPSHSPDITEAELLHAIQIGKPGCSVGIDGVSLEVLKAITSTPPGLQALLSWFNHILHSGQIPARWQDVLLVVLPKCDNPQLPKQTRGIAMGCAAEKLFCRVLLERAKPLLPFHEPWQCCAPSRQSSDLIFSLHRLAELEREWGRGVCILKLDLRAAFDHVSRDRLLEQLFRRLGDCEEYRIWENLFMSSHCTLQSAWGVSRFPTQRGIRQGAIESPYMFGLLIEWTISTFMATSCVLIL